MSSLWPVSSKFPSPANAHNYSNKPIKLPCGSQKSLHPVNTTKPMVVTLPPSTAKGGDRKYAEPSSLWEYMGLIHCCQSHLSSVGCCVFSHSLGLSLNLPFSLSTEISCIKKIANIYYVCINHIESYRGKMITWPSWIFLCSI